MRLSVLEFSPLICTDDTDRPERLTTKGTKEHKGDVVKACAFLRVCSVVRFLLLGQDLHYRVQHPVCDFPLTCLGNAFRSGMGKDGNGVAIRIKANAGLRDVIQDNRVQRLGLEFLLRVFQHVLGLGGKANHNAAILLGSNLGKYVYPWAQVPE